MDWNDILYFLAVARTGGLTPASVELGVSPATVSRRIDAFEQCVGMVLFLRRQTGYLLTDEGESMVEAVLPVEQAMLGFERQTQYAGKAGQWSGTIRVATSEAVATYWITPRLGEFLERYPGLKVELITGIEAVNLSRRDADIALRMMPPSKDDEGDYIAQALGELRFAAYVSPELLQTSGDWRSIPPVSWAESMSHLPMAKWSDAMLLNQASILSNSMNVHRVAAGNGLGVAVLPMRIGDSDPHLLRVEPDHFACSRNLWLIFHRDLRASQRVIALRDFLVTLF
jgi:DNA-binding transcriptional LysR family regulator